MKTSCWISSGRYRAEKLTVQRLNNRDSISLRKQPPHSGGLKAARCEAAVFAGYDSMARIHLLANRVRPAFNLNLPFHFLSLACSYLLTCFRRYRSLWKSQRTPSDQISSVTAHKICSNMLILDCAQSETILSVSVTRINSFSQSDD